MAHISLVLEISFPDFSVFFNYIKDIDNPLKLVAFIIAFFTMATMFLIFILKDVIKDVEIFEKIISSFESNQFAEIYKNTLIFFVIVTLIAFSGLIMGYYSFLTSQEQPENNIEFAIDIKYPDIENGVIYFENNPYMYDLTVKGNTINLPEENDVWLVLKPENAANYYPFDEPASVDRNGDWVSRTTIGPIIKDREIYDIIPVLTNDYVYSMFYEYNRTDSEKGWPGIDFSEKEINNILKNRMYKRISIVFQKKNSI